MDEEVKARFTRAYEAGMMTADQYDELINMPGPEFLAPVVAYLCTEEAAMINGKVIGCGGGRVALFSDPVEIKGIYKDYRKDGPWSIDDLIKLVPNTLLS